MELEKIQIRADRHDWPRSADRKLPAMSEAPLSVVIVNFNAGSLLSDCVQSVRESLPNSEIIVVDNGSSDSSLDTLEQRIGRFTDQGTTISEGKTRILRNDNNLGFAVAVNQGIRAASGRYVAVLNPDCVVEQDLFDKLRTVLESNPQVGMAGPLIVNPDGSEQAGCRRDVPTPWRSFVRAFGLSRLSRWWPQWFPDFSLNTNSLPDRPVEVEAISGACMYVRRQALEDVGLLDEGYFLHCEDLDWCMRFRERGWKILFVPDAIVTHHKGACSKSRPIRVEWHKHCGMVRFHNKFFRKQYPSLVTGVVWVGTWLHFALVSVYYGLRNVLIRIRSTYA